MDKYAQQVSDNKEVFNAVFEPFRQGRFKSMQDGQKAIKDLFITLQSVFDAKVDLRKYRQVFNDADRFGRVGLEWDSDGEPLDWYFDVKRNEGWIIGGRIVIPESAIKELDPTMILGAALEEYCHSLQEMEGTRQSTGGLTTGVAHDITPSEIRANEFVFDVFDDFGFNIAT